MKRPVHLSLILPCYNEGNMIEQSVASILGVLRDTRFSFELILIDDGSIDATWMSIQTVCGMYPECVALRHEKNMGRGATVSEGILASHGVVVGYIDIDCEVSPVYIPQMVSMILDKKADMVIGKRIYRTTFFSIPREICSKGYMWLVSMLLGTEGIDTESGYKFFDRKKIVPIIKGTKNAHWFWDTEVVIRAKRKGLCIHEIPVLYIRRFDKQSSVRVMSDALSYLLHIWRFWREG